MGTLAITIFPGGRPSAPYRHAESHQFTRCIEAELSLVADHRVVKIQDGLYVLGQRSGLPEGTVNENRLPQADAAALSAWLRGDPTSNATLAMLQTPAHLTDREWSVLIAHTFADPAVTSAPVR